MSLAAPVRTSVARALPAAFFAVAAIALAQPARAAVGDPCAASADCDAGEVCNSGACLPERFRPCESDDVCNSGDICLSETVFRCEGSDGGRPAPPARCSADSDCGPDGVCIDSVCASPADPGEDVSCDTVEVTFCGPRYLGGCAEDADCGEGFECQALVACACEGGGGTDPDDGGSERENDPPECVCEEVPGEGFCALLPLPCESDEECPADFECLAFGDDGVCSIDDDGFRECTEPSEEKFCIPEGYLGGGPFFPSDDLVREGEKTDNEDGGENPSGNDNDGDDLPGCAHAPAAPVTPALGLVGIGALAVLLRRRRR
jgi:MYXO-CTERM domain-containing protein